MNHTRSRPPCPPRRRVRSRAFTIVEMVVVLVIIGLLIGFALPRIGGASATADDQKATTTASGALDTIVQLHDATASGNGITPWEGPDCTLPHSPRQQTDMDHAPLPTGTPRPALTLGKGYATSPATATNCPQFVNPATLHDVNGDVTFVRGDQPSHDSATASIAAIWDADHWHVAVAVFSLGKNASSAGELGTCWTAWRDFPADFTSVDPSTGATRTGGGGVAQERYFADTTIDATDAGTCSADVGLSLVVDQYCRSLDGTSQPALGMSWRRPCANSPH